MIGSPDGFLPSFVLAEPPVPYREQTTNGGFTRGFLEFSGTSAQAALEDLTDFVRLYPGGATDDGAVENMVDSGLYQTADAVPDSELLRHFDRIRTRGAEGGEHFGEIDAVRANDLIMRAGKTHYPDPEDFIGEAVDHGISKAIPLGQKIEPPVIQPGVTRMWIIHPDTRRGWGVIGYAYLQEIVFTEPADGNVPKYVQDLAQTGRLDVVDIEDPPDADDGPATTVSDFMSDADGADDADHADGADRADGRSGGDEADDPDADPGDDDPETVVPSENGSVTDVQKATAALETAFDHQELRTVAAALGKVDAPRHPSTADLIDALDDAAVTPADARAVLEDDHGE